MVRSPKLEARVAGALYVLVILLGGFAEIGGREGVVVAGDPHATAVAILSHAAQFRAGFAAELLTNLIAIPATVLVFRLLQPVSAAWALTAAVFDLTQNAVNALNAWTQYAPLTLLEPSRDLAAIPLAQRDALARLALTWHDVGFNIALSFFGVALAIYGVLIFRSGFWPRWLGALYGLAGISYLANAGAYFFAPAVASPGFLLLCFVGEAAFALWLLLVGVNVEAWRRRAEAARSG